MFEFACNSGSVMLTDSTGKQVLQIRSIVLQVGVEALMLTCQNHWLNSCMMFAFSQIFHLPSEKNSLAVFLSRPYAGFQMLEIMLI